MAGEPLPTQRCMYVSSGRTDDTIIAWLDGRRLCRSLYVRVLGLGCLLCLESREEFMGYENGRRDGKRILIPERTEFLIPRDIP